MIENYLLEKLASFAKEGNLLKGSEKLNVTQPALTRSIKSWKMKTYSYRYTNTARDKCPAQRNPDFLKNEASLNAENTC